MPDDGNMGRSETRRRQRRRNLVMLIVLIGVAALFYAISVVKFRVGH